MKLTIEHGVNNWPNISFDESDTVGAFRESCAATFGIPTDTEALVNGEKAEDNTVLKDGDIVRFHKPTGSKG